MSKLSELNFKNISDALQQNREQVAQAYFEIWTIEVIFWLIFKTFLTKYTVLIVACHIRKQ